MTDKELESIVSKEEQLAIINQPSLMKLSREQQLKLQSIYNKMNNKKDTTTICFPCIVRAYSFLRNKHK